MSFSELQRIAAESGIPDEKIGVDAAIRVAAERFAGEYYPASDWSMLYDTMPDPTDPNITIRTLQFSNKTDSSVQPPTVVQIYVVENAQVEETAATGYTVNFKNGERIYQYLIDKYTGEILRELSFDADLTEENVAQPAYAYLGVSKEDVKRTKVISRRLDDDTFLVYLERQDGRTFCVVFIADGAYYTSCVIPDVPFPEDN